MQSRSGGAVLPLSSTARMALARFVAATKRYGPAVLPGEAQHRHVGYMCTSAERSLACHTHVTNDLTSVK
jgi:hypothetical protein